MKILFLPSDEESIKDLFNVLIKYAYYNVEINTKKILKRLGYTNDYENLEAYDDNEIFNGEFYPGSEDCRYSFNSIECLDDKFDDDTCSLYGSKYNKIAHKFHPLVLKNGLRFIKIIGLNSFTLINPKESIMINEGQRNLI